MTDAQATPAAGESVIRVEDRDLSVAAAKFVRDEHPPDVLWLTFARSSVAHAILTTVDCDAARSLTGVVEILTARELPPNSDLIPPLARDGEAMRSCARPLLARDRIRFYGEPLAAVLSESQYAGYDAQALVHPRTEPLPVVTNALEAASSNAPLLFASKSNVLFSESEGWEDAGAVLAACDHAISRRFTVGRYTPVPLETRGLVVVPDRGAVTVWCSTQAPAQLKRAIIHSLNLPEDRVRVIASRVGGGFGQKAHAHPEEVMAALCALRTGRPVKWLESRIESVQASTHARDQIVDCEAGYDDDGRLRVLRCDVTSDVGAYGVWPHGHLLEALGTPVAMPGAYDLKAFGYRTRAVATNKCPGGAQRGVGFAVATFVRERMVEIVAGNLGKGAVDFRARNCHDAGSAPRSTATGLELRGEFVRLLREAEAALLGGTRPDVSVDPDLRVGSGYSLYVEPVSPGSLVFSGRGMAGIVGYDEARVKLDQQGLFVIVTSSPAIGQGTETTYAQVVAAVLGCSPKLVRVDPSDTDRGLDGTGTFASRSAASVSIACERAARILREQLLMLAAARLKVSTDELEIEDDAVVVSDRPSARVALTALAGDAPAEMLEVWQRNDPGAGAVAYGVHACTVAADVRTGKVDVLRYVVAEDCGEMINPGIVRNQTLGAVAQSAGMCFAERLEYAVDGRPLVDGLANYRVPRLAEAPECEMRHLKTQATSGRRLGVAEGGAVAPAGALANAVSAALGVEVNSMPFDPVVVWRLAQDMDAGVSQPQYQGASSET